MTSLQDKHTFALPAQADNLVNVTKLSDLSKVEWQEDSWILGAGSNTLFTTDYEGQILRNCLMGGSITTRQNDTLLRVAAGENWHHWVRLTVEKGLAGLENLALIPGTVGAAPVQNIGAYGVEVSQFIERVEVYDLVNHKHFNLSAGECQFAYRQSIFKHAEYCGWFITHVTLALPKAWSPVLNYPDLQDLNPASTAVAVMNKVIQVRKGKLPDPTEIPNAGSFFKNPHVSSNTLHRLLRDEPEMPHYKLADGSAKLAAGWLIEQTGMKSVHVGGAGVHSRQALVLVNNGGATGNEVIELAREVIHRVKSCFDVQLEPEVRILGDKGLLAL